MGALKLISWNVNSVRARLDRLLAVLARHEPDVVCLQETKGTADTFPADRIRDAGYHAEVHGQRTYNGVALLTREPARDVVRGFDGDPIPEQARAISADVGGVRVIDVYVVNGKAVGDPKYGTKLAWLDGLCAWLAKTHDPAQPLVVTGDFNIAPADLDVHDPDRWRDRVLCSDPERERYQRLLAWGLVDLHRRHAPDERVFSWWDYRAGAFPRDWGLRIDLALGTAPVAAGLRGVEVDRDERKKSSGEGNPSDHAPLILTFDPP